ncbi:MAG TPA: DUF983 domain-containing protein [Bacteroidia bacterium]|nr:DUF983 domain-containing protein [Bacteroidia bacterium]
MNVLRLFQSVTRNKCPRCHQGDVFVHRNPYHLGGMFSMHKTCSHCELRYEREPSFFYGAMYASYALTAGWFVLWFFIDKYILHLDPLVFGLLITASIILLSPLSMRLSRLLWLNFFNPYKAQYLNNSNLNQKQ